MVSSAADFGLETAQHLVAVELQVFGVSPHKADRVGRAGQQVGSSGLERRQVVGLDLERVRDIAQVEAQRLALLPQQLPGRSRPGRRHGAVREFVHETSRKTPEQRHVMIPRLHHLYQAPPPLSNQEATMR